jgi:chromatin remodeling complex protein RSC6
MTQTKPKSATKTVPASEPVKVSEPVKPVKSEEVATAGEDEVTQRFSALLEKLVLITVAVKDMQTAIKTLQKDYSKLSKSSGKKKANGNKNGAKRSPSGFAKPTGLSNELCDFLSLPHGSQKARTDVTRMLNEYIKKHNLQDTKDKRTIIPDLSLKKLMKITDKDTLTYFNLQTYIKHHFLKAAAA